MFGDMMGKLKEMQQKSEEVKKQLENIILEAEAEGGLVKACSNGNRQITSIKISAELIEGGDQEQIEELTQIAVNRALQKAEKKAEEEMQGVAKGMLPGMM